jgi:DNA modification methylase
MLAQVVEQYCSMVHLKQKENVASIAGRDWIGVNDMARLVDIDNDKFWDILFDEAYVEGNQAERIEKELNKITTNGWIPISSGNLPYIYTQVLCCNDSGEVMVGRISWDEDSEDFVAWGRIGAYNDWMPQVVAWMPIVPYKVEG